MHNCLRSGFELVSQAKEKHVLKPRTPSQRLLSHNQNEYSIELLEFDPVSGAVSFKKGPRTAFSRIRLVSSGENVTKPTDGVASGSSTRRSFLKHGLGIAVATSTLDGTLKNAVAQNAPAIANGAPDVAVVGAGAFGAWTALFLRERGVKVTLIDAYGPGNARSTSSGQSRQIRYGYGDREVYTRSIVKAFPIWRAREKEWGVKLLYPGTRLSMGERSGPRLEAQKQIFERLHLPYEMVKHDELSRRFPQVSFEGIEESFVEPDAAMIMAKDAILKIADEFVQRGGTLRIAQAMPGATSGRRLETLNLTGNETLRANTFVFACGPWLRKMFPGILSRKLAITRCDVVYFGTPPGDTRFFWPNFPQLNGEMSTYAAFPESAGLKVIPVGGGNIDPDDAERIVAPEQVRRAREYIARRIPALKDQPIASGEVCQFETAANEDFLIDKHPDYDNVWIAGGGSAHGFKHGPTIGEYIADRVSGRPGEPEMDKIFSLAEHKEVTATGGMGG